MTNRPELSILMSVYNAEPYLEACLGSLLSQSYTNWQLLVADDFSQDESADILKEFASKDQRIKLFQHPKKGLIEALSYLEKHINTNMVSRMDADDLMPENKLSLLTDELKLRGKGHLVTGKVRYFSSGKTLNEGYLKYENWLNSLVDKQMFWSDIYKECVIASPNWVMYAEDLKKCGGISAGIYPEDYDLCFRWYAHKIAAVGVDQVTHLWRDHQSRTSRNSEVYQDNTFLKLKAQYFYQLEANHFDHIILWGAGKKGKTLAQHFNGLNMPFDWLSNNKKKTGHTIHGHDLKDVASFKFEANSAVIVATTQDREEISELCSLRQLQPFFFC